MAIIFITNKPDCVLNQVQVEAEQNFNFKHGRMQTIRTFIFVKFIDSNLTAEDILLITGFESVCYEEIRTTFGAQSAELWERGGYMNL